MPGYSSSSPIFRENDHQEHFSPVQNEFYARRARPYDTIVTMVL